MKNYLKQTIVVGLLLIGFAAYSPNISAAGVKPSEAQEEAEYQILGVSGTNGTGGTVDNCGLFDGIRDDGYNGSTMMYWWKQGDYLEIDIKENCNIWRSGTQTWNYRNAPLIISRWNGTSYTDITSTITQITTDISNASWEKTISDLPMGRYRFDYGGEEPFRLDTEWYIEAADTPTSDLNILKIVLEPEEELQLSVDTDLTKNTELIMTSSNVDVAAVNNDGIVMAKKAGNTVITVKNEDGSYQDQINILVVDNADHYRLAVDLNVSETCRITMDDYTFSKTVTWSAMDSGVASVSEKGKVTAIGEGLTIVKATDKTGNIIGQVYIRVRK